MKKSQRPIWYEFFAGGGMARLGLGTSWECVFANDICEKKARAYRGYFGPSSELAVRDVGQLTLRDLPGTPDLVWASFPCQDLSLAGSGAGLEGHRSGTFRPFWALVRGLIREDRAPRIAVLENVVGTLSSHGGTDFSSIVMSLMESGYRTGAIVINASRFLPQSRPRLFIIGVRGDASLAPEIISEGPSRLWHTESVVRAYKQLPKSHSKNWLWWALPTPSHVVPSLVSIIEDDPVGVKWNSTSETQRLMNLMGPLHKKKVFQVSRLKGRHVGTIYKRTRPNRTGARVQRAEVRFDGISGCLRTPVGGSSRQTVIVIEDGEVRTRLLSAREAARLMGVPDSYPIPQAYNEAYHLFGDGVAVPVVSWLDRHLLSPLLACGKFEQVA
ncbi:MAG: DNA cytosine methyltransferase [Candidatus Acidiferrales bacterium]